ncbi:hypothetical protein JL720_9892 [Aureococcus anophagefferens]|nr:hypothetical protein JL720_9892 [Aureococcus anophagefferens]
MSMQMTPYRDGSFDHRESEADDFLGVNFDGKSTLADVPYAPWGDDDDDDDSAVSSEDEAAFFSAALTTVFNPDVLEDDLSQRIIVRAAAAAMNVSVADITDYLVSAQRRRLRHENGAEEISGTSRSGTRRRRASSSGTWALGDDDVEILLDLVCDDAATAQAAAGAFHGAVDDGSLTTELRTYAASYGAAGLSASAADVVVAYLERAEATPAPAASYSYSYEDEDGGASAATYLAVSLDLGGTSTEELFVDGGARAARVRRDGRGRRRGRAGEFQRGRSGRGRRDLQGLATDMGVDALLEATADDITVDIAGYVPPAPTAGEATSETYVAIALDISGTSTEELFVDDTALYVILSSISSTMGVSDDALSNFGVVDSVDGSRRLSDGVTFTCSVAVDSYGGETKGSALEDAVADGSFTTTMRSLATDMGADDLTDATADAATYAVVSGGGSDSGRAGGVAACESGAMAYGSNGLDWSGFDPMWAYAEADSIECSTAAFGGDDPRRATTSGAAARTASRRRRQRRPSPASAEGGGDGCTVISAPAPAPTFAYSADDCTAAQGYALDIVTRTCKPDVAVKDRGCYPANCGADYAARFCDSMTCIPQGRAGVHGRGPAPRVSRDSDGTPRGSGESREFGQEPDRRHSSRTSTRASGSYHANTYGAYFDLGLTSLVYEDAMYIDIENGVSSDGERYANQPGSQTYYAAEPIDDEAPESLRDAGRREAAVREAHREAQDKLAKAKQADADKADAALADAVASGAPERRGFGGGVDAKAAERHRRGAKAVDYERLKEAEAHKDAAAAFAAQVADLEAKVARQAPSERSSSASSRKLAAKEAKLSGDVEKEQMAKANALNKLAEAEAELAAARARARRGAARAARRQALRDRRGPRRRAQGARGGTPRARPRAPRGHADTVGGLRRPRPPRRTTPQRNLEETVASAKAALATAHATALREALEAATRRRRRASPPRRRRARGLANGPRRRELEAQRTSPQAGSAQRSPSRRAFDCASLCAGFSCDSYSPQTCDAALSEFGCACAGCACDIVRNGTNATNATVLRAAAEAVLGSIVDVAAAAPDSATPSTAPGGPSRGPGLWRAGSVYATSETRREILADLAAPCSSSSAPRTTSCPSRATGLGDDGACVALYAVDGSGHYPHVERPVDFDAQILDFFGACKSASQCPDVPRGGGFDALMCAVPENACCPNGGSRPDADDAADARIVARRTTRRAYCSARTLAAAAWPTTLLAPAACAVLEADYGCSCPGCDCGVVAFASHANHSNATTARAAAPASAGGWFKTDHDQDCSWVAEKPRSAATRRAARASGDGDLEGHCEKTCGFCYDPPSFGDLPDGIVEDDLSFDEESINLKMALVIYAACSASPWC